MRSGRRRATSNTERPAHPLKVVSSMQQHRAKYAQFGHPSSSTGKRHLVKPGSHGTPPDDVVSTRALVEGKAPGYGAGCGGVAIFPCAVGLCSLFGLKAIIFWARAHGVRQIFPQPNGFRFRLIPQRVPGPSANPPGFRGGAALGFGFSRATCPSPPSTRHSRRASARHLPFPQSRCLLNPGA